MEYITLKKGARINSNLQCRLYMKIFPRSNQLIFMYNKGIDILRKREYRN
jgi:hypothetical protein